MSGTCGPGVTWRYKPDSWHCKRPSTVRVRFRTPLHVREQFLPGVMLVQLVALRPVPDVLIGGQMHLGISANGMAGIPVWRLKTIQ
jgi:hypothetical protein